MDPAPPTSTDPDTGEIEDFRQEMTCNIREAWKNAKEHADKAREQFKNSYETTVRPSDIKVGDRVLMKNYFSKKNLSRKLVLPWVGQYRVLEINRPEAVIQDITSPHKTRRVHLDHVKKYHGVTGPAATTAAEEETLDAQPEQDSTQQPDTQPAAGHVPETEDRSKSPEEAEHFGRPVTEAEVAPRYDFRASRKPPQRFLD
uniref:Integrase catalytic domain-containing protein n=1 Tax=Caenorhabditis japonica TaxID=281687 RepID=A0A8R1EGK9_CAEJA